ncbi:class I SAM-dependent DNA methyltransferase [Mobiluncus curtisii]|uniref:site-specific DNA-methyltransferase (adenine-specific) n=2 Tax=Mobiluncus curtisii TaxID=2051 RepID=A0A7Y0UFQ3_9ACTO|nr:class I SAM-dependent DNA methyltransferase [Mobiluncus curtisii]MCU9986745.1 class I SAM-dependent DNA methyltransferase [Mobiluncus curtisii]MCU9999646.1 class I SAM-dependent DNA methyltransferase [Mobiluncus curtisii]NMW49375.1 class I SAM-dependent DNA methyltransferase [Mobiluncus curtisii]NMW86479.1 class I SAM-dependent DNA methyltransferase [Mobiluncus curtisii]NMX13786.1 class I SAM-dependent DNA methyltransferase [Mobiluncus curtisii]
MVSDLAAAREFAAQWVGKGYEKGECQKFWTLLLHDVLGYERMESVRFEHRVAGGGFIDVWIRDASVMVEQKSLGVDLDAPEMRQGVLKTPLAQVWDYAEDLPRTEQPRFLVTCNFGEFRVYDRNRGGRRDLEGAPTFAFTLAELGEHPEYLGFIIDPINSRLEKEKQVSIQAGELVGRLHDGLLAQYLEPDTPETRHALNVLCVRLVFCLYCEDAGLFQKDAFYRYLKGVAPADVRPRLKLLFRALDTPVERRDPYDTTLREFPYVNGGLFAGDFEIPNFSPELLGLLLDEVSRAVDWSQISPTIFGGIFESTLNPETRRAGGMHYTSPENIHKVIDPLFLDDLKAELQAIDDAEGLTPRQRTNRYRAFHERLCKMRFLDPASGSGNFLTETYLQLRHLEDEVLSRLNAGQTAFSLAEVGASVTRVSLDQFYGIEINDFAVKVSEAALWISRLKANGETEMLLSLGDDDFPLRESAHIVQANALTLDWNTVLPADQCSYVLGNPPFIGYSRLDESQKADRLAIFGKVGGVLDYVACWYRKAADYMRGNRGIQAAFVSTNSIVQGQQVAPLWRGLFESGIVLNFAHRTFIWANEASDQAHVYCVIIGFSYTERKTKYVWDYAAEVPSPSDAAAQRTRRGGIGMRHEVNHLNGYLADAPDVFLERQMKPLCDVPEMAAGGKPTEGGHLLLSPEERAELLAAEPGAARWVRKFSMGAEFIRGEDRYCLWLEGITPNELAELPTVRKRVEQVRLMRLASSKAATRKKAETPWLFDEIRYRGEGTYIGVPAVSSERRDYIPMGFVTDGMIPGNKLYFVPTDSRYVFGVLVSRAHNAWTRVVSGRLKSDYNYGNTTVYNNLVWPDATPAQRERIEHTAQGILEARSLYPDASLATLYDPDLMPVELRAAHRENDRAVEAAYGLPADSDEAGIVSHLFALYATKTCSTPGKCG